MSPTFQLDVGDALDVLRSVPSESIGAVVTDAPYGVDFISDWSREGTPGKRSKIANDRHPFVWWLHDAARVMRPGSPLVSFCRWDTAEAFKLAIEWAGLSIRGQVIWDRVDHGMGDLRSTPGPQHDTIWIASKGRYQFPRKRPKSVVRHRRVHAPQLKHPNEKPLELMLDLISSYVAPGSAILDPFAGSGTTGVAALQLGYDVRLIEIDPAYAEIARGRCEAALEYPTSSTSEISSVGSRKEIG